MNTGLFKKFLSFGAVLGLFFAIQSGAANAVTPTGSLEPEIDEPGWAVDPANPIAPTDRVQLRALIVELDTYLNSLTNNKANWHLRDDASNTTVIEQATAWVTNKIRSGEVPASLLPAFAANAAFKIPGGHKEIAREAARRAPDQAQAIVTQMSNGAAQADKLGGKPEDAAKEEVNQEIIDGVLEVPEVVQAGFTDQGLRDTAQQIVTIVYADPAAGVFTQGDDDNRPVRNTDDNEGGDDINESKNS